MHNAILFIIFLNYVTTFYCINSICILIWIFCENVGIDGQEGMKLIFGIIVVEGRDNQGKVAKVNLEINFPFLPDLISILNVNY